MIKVASSILKKQIKNAEWMPQTVAFQYASHLYNSKLNVTVPYLYPVAPYLILSGNIGKTDSQNPYRFMRWCAINYEKVWWIPGPVEEHIDKMQKIIIDVNDRLPEERIIMGWNSYTLLPNYNVQLLGIGGGCPLTSIQKSVLESRNPKTKTLVMGYRDIQSGVKNTTIKAYFIGEKSKTVSKSWPPILFNPLFINDKFNMNYSTVAVYDLPLDAPNEGAVSENVEDLDMLNSRGLLPAY